MIVHLGEVVQIVAEVPPKPEGGWRSVERRATPRDLLLLQSWQAKQTEAMINCRARASELGLEGVMELNGPGHGLNYDLKVIYPQEHVWPSASCPNSFRFRSGLRGYKGAVVNQIKRLEQNQYIHIWQRNYYEHVVRNDEDLIRIHRYIEMNIGNWSIDNENPDL